jgi:hypothetical protein
VFGNLIVDFPFLLFELALPDEDGVKLKSFDSSALAVPKIIRYSETWLIWLPLGQKCIFVIS